MRLRRFRPDFDRLGLRIAPSDVTGTSSAGSDGSSSVSTSSDPVMMVDISGTIDYSSSDSSDTNTLDTTVSAGN